MKKALFTFAIVLLSVAAQAQIKMHSNGRITFQTLANTTTQGISIGPAPDCNFDINGAAYFHRTAFFVKPAVNYEWINGVHTTQPSSASWVVAYPDWDNLKFWVYGNGTAYATNHYTITLGANEHRGSEAIVGEEALSIIEGLNGYYYDPEEQEIPDLENNEFVEFEAIEAMYADFEKRTAALSSRNLEEVFPEAVRTDPQNRLCINYQSVVTMLVEAVKAQQKQIDDLKTILRNNGLLEK